MSIYKPILGRMKTVPHGRHLMLFGLSLILLAFESPNTAQAVDLLDYFFPEETQPGRTVRNVQINDNEVFFTFPASIEGRDGFVIIKSWDGKNYEEFTYDEDYIYHWRDTTWARRANEDFTCTGPPGNPHIGHEAFFTLLDGYYGSLDAKEEMCEEWEKHRDMEGARWTPRYMSVGQEECFNRTVIGFSERHDCICCTTDVVGPGTTCMRLVARYDHWQGDHPDARRYDDVIRITAVSGPGKGESWYYAKGYGWVGYERRPSHVDPIGGRIDDWNYARLSEFDSIAWDQVCPHGDADPPAPPKEDDEIINALANAPNVGGDKPWEDDGITAAWVNIDGNLGLISKDRYWVLRLSDRSWSASGFFKDLPSDHVWKQAPHDGRVDDRRPWESEGITAGWVNGDDYLGATSKDKYWVQDLNSRRWLAWGKYENLPSDHVWKQAPKVDDLYPWEGAGITAGWFEDANGWVIAINKDRYWTQDFSSRSWRWWGKFDDLPSNHAWKKAPRVNGRYPWESDGMTAGFVAEGKLYVFSNDRYWVKRLSDDAWIASGQLGDDDTPPPPSSDVAPLRIINGDQNPDIWSSLWITQCLGNGRQRVWQVDASQTWAIYTGTEDADTCGEPNQGLYPLIFRWSDVGNEPNTWITWCTGNGDEEWVWIPDGSSHAPFAYPQHDSDGSCSR